MSFTRTSYIRRVWRDVVRKVFPAAAIDVYELDGVIHVLLDGERFYAFSSEEFAYANYTQDLVAEVAVRGLVTKLLAT